jgi:hypothetical protein
MAVTILTGKKAAIDGVSCATEWGCAAQAEDVFAICSASDGAPVRAVGNEDWSVYWEAYGSTPAKLPGALFTFTGATETGGGATSIANGAIVKQIRVDWPVSTGAFVHHRVDGECAEGALTFGASTATDVNIPNPLSAKQLYATFGGVDITHVTDMVFAAQCKNADSIDSSSAGIRNRKKGNYDAVAVVRVNVEAFASLPVTNTIGILAIGKGTAVTPWTVHWMKLMNIKPVVDIEGNDGKPKVVGADLQFAFTGYNGGVKGFITTPLGGTLWP